MAHVEFHVASEFSSGDFAILVGVDALKLLNVSLVATGCEHFISSDEAISVQIAISEHCVNLVGNDV